MQLVQQVPQVQLALQVLPVPQAQPELRVRMELPGEVEVEHRAVALGSTTIITSTQLQATSTKSHQALILLSATLKELLGQRVQLVQQVPQVRLALQVLPVLQVLLVPQAHLPF